MLGNYIGADATGQSAIANLWQGVNISGNDNLVSDGNVISGNHGHGIYIARWSDAYDVPENNTVSNNKIGTNATGTSFLPNEHGITIVESANSTITGNLIAGNQYTGVSIDRATSVNNLVSRNSIHSNGALGIELNNDGITPNDPGDVDPGPNNLMNYPVLEFAVAFRKICFISGWLDTPDPETATIELFVNPGGSDPTGFGEGEIFLGTVQPNPVGTFIGIFPAVALGTLISATATDEQGNTSEFAGNIEMKDRLSLPKALSSHPEVKKVIAELETEDLPGKFELAQNYPNPFNQATTINYHLKTESPVKLTIYDVTGREVQMLVNKVQDQGSYSVHFDASLLASGVYIYKLKAGAFEKTRKMMLLR